MTDTETTPISDIADLPAGVAIARLTGKLKVAFPPKSGTSAKTGYSWHRQGFVLTDGKNEVVCNLWGRTDLNMEQFTGREVIVSTPGGRYKFPPVATSQGKDPRSGEPRMELSISKDAIVVPEGGGVPAEFKRK
jgi:hypothetical protein